MLPIVLQRALGIGSVIEVVLVRKIILVFLCSWIMEIKEEIVSVNILWY